MMATTREKTKVFAATTFRHFFYVGCMKSFGVILNDTINQTRGSLPLVALSFSALYGLSSASAPLVIHLMKVFSSRSIVLVGGFLVGVGFICEAFLANNLWKLFISNVITGIGFGISNIPLYIALAETFQDSFGTAHSAVSFIGNFGMMLIPLLLEYWREKYGLTGSLVLFGALMWNQIVSGVLLESKASTEHRKEPIDEEAETSSIAPRPDPSASMEDSGGIYHAIIAHPTIPCFYAAQCIHMLVMVSWCMFLLPYGVEKGYTQGEAILLTTIGGFGFSLGRGLVIFVFYLKWQSRLVLIITPISLATVFFVLTVFTNDLILLCFESGIIGICLGYISSWMFSYGRDITCLHHFNSTAAWSMLSIGTGMICSGPLSGSVYNIRGTYDDVFIFLTILAVVEAVTIIASISLNRRSPSCDYGDK
ncbi:monocarboxylate transporter 1-like [Apostichopus japonicus]|uniref:monocarboxylate transporter 1-like n=1 Tax=Stichopus japonicus TaxID=307972 RepID=UPI003AB434BF